ncbi:hypothetical protein QOT17_020149 [Balamuthia mandrillaris]
METARKGQARLGALCPRCEGGGVVALRPYHINFVEAVLLCPQCPYPLDSADVGDFLLNDHPIDTSAALANASFGVAVQKEESLSPDKTKGAQQQASIADKVLSEEEFAFLLGYLRGNESLPSSASAFSSSPSFPSSVSLRTSSSSLSSPSSTLSCTSSSSSSSGSFSTSSLSLHHLSDLSSSPTSSTTTTELLRSVLSSPPSAPSSSFSPPSTFASAQEHASLTLLSSSPSRQEEENRLLASLMMEAHSTSGTDDEELGFPH